MMPNETMQQIVRQLPEGALDLRDLALHHSLFPFRLRFLPTQQKQDYLERFCKGEDIQPHLLSITKKLREQSASLLSDVCTGGPRNIRRGILAYIPSDPADAALSQA